MNTDQILNRVRHWAAERDLLAPSRAFPQAVKLFEEGGELAGAVARNNRPKIIDGIGNCVVVLTIMAAQHGTTIEECVAAAWDEIKDRTGKTVNGVFVKDDE